jgi:hypothetical protein
MFYDFAPHGDGANNAGPRPVAERGHLALCLLSVSECVVPGVGYPHRLALDRSNTRGCQV